MELPIYQVDAFSGVVFRGNPAAVCPLHEWLPDEMLQAIAEENNLADTAYFIPNGTRFHLRWFTPAKEIDLCGHATLAAAYVLFKYISQPGETIYSDTKSGELTVTREGDLLSLDFPSRPALPMERDSAMVSAIGGNPIEMLAARDVLVVYETEAEVLALKPDMNALMKVAQPFFIATAPGTKSDFVSRFFAPAFGVPEDPVTGSAHCTLIPYWAKKLGKNKLFARQVSQRIGELHCQLLGDRVKMAGYVAPYMRGTIFIT